jgi:hypothetical protein
MEPSAQQTALQSGDWSLGLHRPRSQITDRSAFELAGVR